MNTDKKEPESQPDFDLDDPKWYLNRELTWLAFNQRVLNEAKDSRTPLLERVFFVAVVGSNLDDLFHGLDIHSCEHFRVTRNAITERSEEQANDLLVMIESTLRDRKFADIVRLQIDPEMIPLHRGMLAAELGIDEQKDVFEAIGFMGKRDLMEICKLDRPELHFPVHHPCDNPQLRLDDPNIFHVIRKRKAVLLQHPYESFDTSVALFLKQALLRKIDREIQHHSSNSSGLIQLKTNALEDKAITRALYRASQAGVHVDLIIRDTCRLRPGIEGLSENIRVVSIIGRFLEHARIYYFKNGGKEEYFIGSADLMTRNLEARVEVIAPVEDPALQAQLRDVLDIQLSNRRSVWDMQPDGTSAQRQPGHGDDNRTVHEILIDLVRQRVAASTQTEGGAKKPASKSDGGRKRNVAHKAA